MPRAPRRSLREAHRASSAPYPPSRSRGQSGQATTSAGSNQEHVPDNQDATTRATFQPNNPGSVFAYLRQQNLILPSENATSPVAGAHPPPNPLAPLRPGERSMNYQFVPYIPPQAPLQVPETISEVEPAMNNAETGDSSEQTVDVADEAEVRVDAVEEAEMQVDAAEETEAQIDAAIDAMFAMEWEEFTATFQGTVIPEDAEQRGAAFRRLFD